MSSNRGSVPMTAATQLEWVVVKYCDGPGELDSWSNKLLRFEELNLTVGARGDFEVTRDMSIEST